MHFIVFRAAFTRGRLGNVSSSFLKRFFACTQRRALFLNRFFYECSSAKTLTVDETFVQPARSGWLVGWLILFYFV